MPPEQEIYIRKNMSAVVFIRGGQAFAPVEEKRIYYLEPHLALILGNGYGILVQTIDAKPLDKKEVELLDVRGKEAEDKIVQKEEIKENILKE